MAVQKAEAQKRLMRPTKRVQAEVSEMERRRLLIEKKREDLVRNFERCVLSCCAGYYCNNLVGTKHLISDFILYSICNAQKEQLARLHHYAELEEFENRHCRKFRRIFPPDDKFKRDEYLKLISESFEIVMPGRAQNLQQEFNKFYCSNLQVCDFYCNKTSEMIKKLRSVLEFWVVDKYVLSKFCRKLTYCRCWPSVMRRSSRTMQHPQALSHRSPTNVPR